MAVTYFNAKHTFHSLENLQRFVKAEGDIRAVRSQGWQRSTKAIPWPVKPLPNISFKWHVANFVTFPFRWMMIIFLKSLNLVVKPVSDDTYWEIRNIIRKLEVAFDRFSKPVAPESRTQVYVLGSSQNTPSSNVKLINSHPPLSYKEISDERVKKLLYPMDTKVIFNHDDGNCMGQAQHFIYLYHKTKMYFRHFASHMKALGKQFKDGANKEAMILQSVNDHQGDLHGVKIIAPAPHRFTIYRAANYQYLFNQINKLPSETAYLCIVPGHATVYIKKNDQLGCFFDPNVGEFIIKGPDQGEKLLSLCRLYFSLDFPFSTNSIYFRPTSM